MTDFHPTVSRIAFIGNYYPRQCGIATFTTDLAESISANYPGINCFAIAMNDKEEGYSYMPRVRFELNDQDLFSYKVAAEYLNLNDVDVVSLQHEYGIYGGEEGSYILHLIRELRMPVITTLHTILKDPNPVQLNVLKEIGKLSSRLVVMSELGSEFLSDIYRIPPEKIDFIHHGIPDIPFVDPNYYKDHFGVEGRTVLLTFGLLSRNKGIENVIKALPAIIRCYPDLVYIVLGATHPKVLQSQGESYRHSLEELANELGVTDNIIFDNRFVDKAELIEFIGAADLYITPYLNPQQIASGTLAYAAGAGKAVISTPYWYAEELLSEGRGLLVPFGEPDAIADKVNYLLENDAERHAMRKRAYTFGREMIWPRVAGRYLEVFEKARQEPTIQVYPMVSLGHNSHQIDSDLPKVNLNHLRALTDDCGLFQHAILNLPNYAEGYTTDDNARGLIASVLAETTEPDENGELMELESRYLSFLWYAYHRGENRFRNFLGYDRLWKEDVGSEDSNGRALWSLGLMCARSHHESLQDSASTLFSWVLPQSIEFGYPRAWSFTLLGLDEYLQHFPGDRTAQSCRKSLSDRLLALYRQNSGSEWRWFENEVTYSNARIAQAVIVSGEGQDNPEMLSAGLEALEWLCHVQTSEKGLYSPVGSNGWYPRSGEKARFDQQPVEACATISACLSAYRITRNDFWFEEARRAFQWFLGGNDLGIPLYDPLTGGCQDGLHPDRVNKNQGAESSLSFLISLLEMHSIQSLVEDDRFEDNQIITLPVHHSISGH